MDKQTTNYQQLSSRVHNAQGKNEQPGKKTSESRNLTFQSVQQEKDLNQLYSHSFNSIMSNQSISFSSPYTQKGQQYQQNESSAKKQQSVTASSYLEKKDQVRKVFLSKDELFNKVNNKFKSLLKHKTAYIDSLKNQLFEDQGMFEQKEKDLLEIANDIKQQLQTSMSQQVIFRDSHLINVKSHSSQSSSSDSRRRIWKTKEPKVAKKMKHSSTMHLIKEQNEEEYNKEEESDDSQCNVQDDDEIHQQKLQVQAREEQEESDLANQQYQTMIENQINSVLDIVQQMRSKSEEKQAIIQNEENDIYTIQSVQDMVKELEDRYYESAIAWEKELRELISKNKSKGERIIQLEQQVFEVQQQKNEYKLQHDTLQKELTILTSSLQIYGFTPSDSMPSLDQLKKLFDENIRLKSDIEKLIDNIGNSRQDMHKIQISNKSAVQAIPQMLTQQYKAAKDIYEQQIEQLQKQYECKVTELSSELSRTRARMIDIIDEKTKLENELHGVKLQKKEIKSDLDQKVLRIQELEIMIQENKYKSTHIVMQSESRAVAINEVSSRNEILNESLEKLKLELFNVRKQLTQVENEKFDIEKENLKIKKETKSFEGQIRILNEEKEHLIQMLEMKNHLLSQGNEMGDSYKNQVDFFSAIQKLSLFVLNRENNNESSQSQNHLDEASKNLVRSIFNENVCRLLDQYEIKIEQQRKQMIEQNKELLDLYQLYLKQCEQHLQALELIQQLTGEISKRQISELPTEIIMLNERLVSLSKTFDHDQYFLKQETEKKSEKLKSIHLKLDALRSDTVQNLKQIAISPQKISLKDNQLEEIKYKLNLQIDELKAINENLKMKLDMTISENDDLKRKVEMNKKRDAEFEKLRKQYDSLKDAHQKIQKGQHQNQMEMEKHISSNSDLKKVINKLDIELKKEKSQMQFLKYKVNAEQNDGSLFDGLDGFIEDEEFFKSDSDPSSIMRKPKKKNRSSEFQPGDATARSQPRRNRNKSQLKVEEEKKSQEHKCLLREDISNMLELQCLVIEDLLRSRSGLGNLSARKDEKSEEKISIEEVKQQKIEQSQLGKLSPSKEDKKKEQVVSEQDTEQEQVEKIKQAVALLRKGETGIPRLGQKRERNYQKSI